MVEQDVGLLCAVETRQVERGKRGVVGYEERAPFAPCQTVLSAELFDEFQQGSGAVDS